MPGEKEADEAKNSRREVPVICRVDKIKVEKNDIFSMHVFLTTLRGPESQGKTRDFRSSGARKNAGDADCTKCRGQMEPIEVEK